MQIQNSKISSSNASKTKASPAFGSSEGYFNAVIKTMQSVLSTDTFEKTGAIILEKNPRLLDLATIFTGLCQKIQSNSLEFRQAFAQTDLYKQLGIMPEKIGHNKFALNFENDLVKEDLLLAKDSLPNSELIINFLKQFKKIDGFSQTRISGAQNPPNTASSLILSSSRQDFDKNGLKTVNQLYSSPIKPDFKGISLNTNLNFFSNNYELAKHVMKVDSQEFQEAINAAKKLSAGERTTIGDFNIEKLKHFPLSSNQEQVKLSINHMPRQGVNVEVGSIFKENSDEVIVFFGK